ncbi:asparagine synthase [Xylariaceae sp. FL0594]|nr:asparagine synthase [Xylariaceae sp. FL0594]
MCGISVVVSLKRGHSPRSLLPPRHELDVQLKKSFDTISHRGPDSQDMWINKENTVALGHCRLSINDLSDDGRQPLHDDEGHIHAVINGEVYDNDRLRERCINEFGYKFKGHSDSETVVALYKHWFVPPLSPATASNGAPAFLDHMRGEFSLVIYDDRSGQIIAARDRFGIKPLFWTVLNDDQLLIAAEAKAFLPLGWKPEWDVRSVALTDFFNDSQATVFKDVRKIQPGHYMTVSAEGTFEHRRYWDLAFENKNKVETRSVEEMVLAVREKMMDSIRVRLRADVPVGIYLSGGLDSSAVAGIVKHLVAEEGATMGNIERIACFCIAFDRNSGFDESPIAERTAKHLGVQLHIKDMNEAEIAKHFEETVWHNEHQSFDLNTVGKFCLSELPREKGFKVILSGEGADEIFGGYPWFPVDLLLEPDNSMPHLFLQKNPELRQSLHDKAADDLIKSFSFIGDGPGLEELRADPTVREKMSGAISPAIFCYTTLGTEVFVKSVREKYPYPDRVALKVDAFTPEVKEKMKNSWHPLHTASYVWCKTLLPNFLLTALGDRCEMAHSIEGRPPFLDHELAELINHMPPSVKLHYGSDDGIEGPTSGNTRPWFGNGEEAVAAKIWEKWILREAAKPFITEELYRRRKHPFSAPIVYLEGGPLHKLFTRLLTRENVENVGFVDWPAVQDALKRGFGPRAETSALRACQVVAGIVVISQKFGVARAEV